MVINDGGGANDYDVSITTAISGILTSSSAQLAFALSYSLLSGFLGS